MKKHISQGKIYHIVSRAESYSIIETRKPLGLFLILENETWVGIDNSEGEAWVEEFKTKRTALHWLTDPPEENPK